MPKWFHSIREAYPKEDAKLDATLDETERTISIEEDEDTLQPHLISHHEDDSKSVPDDISQSASALKGGSFLLVWDLVIPLLTWLLLLALLTSTPSKRWIVVAIWATPPCLGGVLSWSFFAQKMLQDVAKCKQLNVFENKQVSTALKGDSPCLIGIHPHGRYPMIIFPWLASRKEDLFSKVVLAQSSLGKFIPTVGLIAMFCNVIDVTKDSIIKSLFDGKNVALFPGGAREMVYCHPGDQTIPLVKRSGFLKLAFHAPSPTPSVIPCFIFGMHDAFFNPLWKLDKVLFEKTGLNIPLWLPTIKTTKLNGSNVMVFGDVLKPTDFPSPEEFEAAYYVSLEKAFESHKKRYPDYESRMLHWIEPSANKKEKKRIYSSNCLLILSLVFVLATALIYNKNNLIYDFSRHSWFAPTFNRTLFVHIGTSSLWVLLSTIQITIKLPVWFHRWLGYLAVATSFVMTGSAFQLSIMKVRDDITHEIPSMDLLANLLHFLGATNFASGHVSQVYGAIVAARNKDIKRHERKLILSNFFLLFGLSPRLVIAFAKWCFPFVSVPYLTSCGVLFTYYVNREKLSKLDVILAETSLLLLLVEYFFGFPLVLPWISPILFCFENEYYYRVLNTKKIKQE